MCPVMGTTAAVLTAASMAISTVGAVTQYMGQQAAADAQAQHQTNVMARTQENAEAARRLEVMQIDRRIEEERDGASQKLQQNSIEAAKARSRARVSSGEAGVSGLSVDALMADFSRQESVYREGVRGNLDRFTDQAQMEKRGSKAKQQSRVNGAFSQMRPVSRPSFLQPAMQIGSAGIDSYRNFNQMRPQE